MWVIGMLVCVGLMLGGGHAAMKMGHGSHANQEGAAGPASTAPGATTAADMGAPADASQSQAKPGHNH